MFRPRIIRYILIAVAVYLSLIGLMFVFFQGLAENVFAIGILDASAHRGWGVCLLILGALCGVLARRPLTYVGLLWLPIAGLLASSAALVYDLLAGYPTLRQFGAPIALNLVFAALLVYFYPRRV